MKNFQERHGQCDRSYSLGSSKLFSTFPSALRGNLTLLHLTFTRQKKVFLFPSVWPRREYLETHLKKTTY